MESTYFKGHMYSSIYEFKIINSLESNIHLLSLLHLESYMLIDVFLVIIGLSATQMEIQDEIL